jgi:phosphohistidine phosphatase
MRHAKAGDEAPSDHARTLAKRGWEEAREMAILLKREGLMPAHILGSSATRARQTAEAVAEQLAYRGDLCFYEDLYESSPDIYLRRLRSLNDAWSPALLVAHNPVIEEFLLAVCGQGIRMKTAAIAQVELREASWSALGADSRGKLAALWEPEA